MPLQEAKLCVCASEALQHFELNPRQFISSYLSQENIFQLKSSDLRQREVGECRSVC